MAGSDAVVEPSLAQNWYGLDVSDQLMSRSLHSTLQRPFTTHEGQGQALLIGGPTCRSKRNGANRHTYHLGWMEYVQSQLADRVGIVVKKKTQCTYTNCR